MVSRATHYRNKAKHDQREFGEVKPRLVSQEEGTSWMGAFVAQLAGSTEPLTVDSPVVAQLGATPKERELRLRELSKLGVLHMSSSWEDGAFLGYRWRLVAGSR